MIKKVTFLLALWFLLDWAYNQKLLPYAKSTFTDGLNKDLLLDGNNSKDTLVFGLDISHYQGDVVEKLNKKQDSIYFVICKATEGTTYTDSMFQSNYEILKEKHIIRGAYHFYHCDSDPIAQAQFFSKTIMDNNFLNVTQLPPVLDIENSSMESNCPNSLSAIQQDVIKFLQEVTKQTGRMPMIYTNKSTGNKYLNNKAFAAYPLWIAAYTNQLQKTDIPTAWNNQWAMWQRSDDYSYQGESFDCDVFNGNRKSMSKFIQKSIVKK